MTGVQMSGTGSEKQAFILELVYGSHQCRLAIGGLLYVAMGCPPGPV